MITFPLKRKIMGNSAATRDELKRKQTVPIGTLEDEDFEARSQRQAHLYERWVSLTNDMDPDTFGQAFNSIVVGSNEIDEYRFIMENVCLNREQLSRLPPPAVMMCIIKAAKGEFGLSAKSVQKANRTSIRNKIKKALNDGE
jgi:hypothetical protein